MAIRHRPFLSECAKAIEIRYYKGGLSEAQSAIPRSGALRFADAPYRLSQPTSYGIGLAAVTAAAESLAKVRGPYIFSR